MVWKHFSASPRTNVSSFSVFLLMNINEMYLPLAKRTTFDASPLIIFWRSGWRQNRLISTTECSLDSRIPWLTSSQTIQMSRSIRFSWIRIMKEEPISSPSHVRVCVGGARTEESGDHLPFDPTRTKCKVLASSVISAKVDASRRRQRLSIHSSILVWCNLLVCILKSRKTACVSGNSRMDVLLARIIEDGQRWGTDEWERKS